MSRQRQTLIPICAVAILMAGLTVGCQDAATTAHQEAAAAAQAAATPPNQRVSIEQARKSIEDNPGIPPQAKAQILAHMGQAAPNPTVH